MVSVVPVREDSRMSKTPEVSQPERSPFLISKREAARLLSVSIRTVENYLAGKELVARHVGGRTLVDFNSVKKFASRDHASPVNGDGAH